MVKFLKRLFGIEDSPPRDIEIPYSYISKFKKVVIKQQVKQTAIDIVITSVDRNKIKYTLKSYVIPSNNNNTADLTTGKYYQSDSTEIIEDRKKNIPMASIQGDPRIVSPYAPNLDRSYIEVLDNKGNTVEINPNNIISIKSSPIYETGETLELVYERLEKIE